MDSILVVALSVATSIATLLIASIGLAVIFGLMRIINMAHGMGLKVVAEGIEMEGQLDYLAKHQCDMIQGYFLSEPLEEEEANLLLIANPYTQWPKVMEKREIFKGRHTDGPYDFY